MVYTFALVTVLFSPDLSGYKDFVGVFPNAAAREKERGAKVKELDALGVRYATACVALAGGTPA